MIDDSAPPPTPPTADPGPAGAGGTRRSDPGDRRSLLGDAQLETLARYGEETAVDAGDVLFVDGDAAYDLIVVLDGEVEIVEHHGRPDSSVIVTYGPCEFLGEIGLLTGQRVFLSAVVVKPGRVLRIPPDQVRVIMDQEPDLSELLLRAFLVRHARLTRRGAGLTLIGSRFDPSTRSLLEVLARNRLSFRWLELEGSPEAEALLRRLDVPVADLPLVVGPGGMLLRNPSGHHLLEGLGLVATPVPDRQEVCDLLVVGGGPAGLSAAVYGASEGMTTTMAEDTALGGQAGTSSRIENYLGFPAGLSGMELTARGALQAEKFGVRIKLGAAAVGLVSEGDTHTVRFADGQSVAARSLIIATGARYNRLPLERLDSFEGVGVYYAATQMEAQACAGGPAMIVGGGNSAGQAAIFLAQSCTTVHIVVRGADLAHSMSRYLIDQIEKHPTIDVVTGTEVVALLGDHLLDGVELRDRASGSTRAQSVSGLFVFIGAAPSTGWLDGQLAADRDGFLLTGADVPAAEFERPGSAPLLLETSRPGVFCVGDVRSGSIKRVATAIGEGSMAVRLVFDRLQTSGLACTAPQPATA